MERGKVKFEAEVVVLFGPEDVPKSKMERILGPYRRYSAGSAGRQLQIMPVVISASLLKGEH